MRVRSYKFVPILMTLLMALSAWTPSSGRAEAQMRCVGAPAQAAPCARMSVPASGMTDGQMKHALMACCRMRSADASPHAATLASPHAALSARPSCTVTVRVTQAAFVPLPAPRFQGFLTAAPSHAPPASHAPAFSACPPVVPVVWTRFSPTRSPHVLSALHGLRAPPAA